MNKINQVSKEEIKKIDTMDQYRAIGGIACGYQSYATAEKVEEREKSIFFSAMKYNRSANLYRTTVCFPKSQIHVVIENDGTFCYLVPTWLVMKKDQRDMISNNISRNGESPRILEDSLSSTDETG